MGRDGLELSVKLNDDTGIDNVCATSDCSRNEPLCHTTWDSQIPHHSHHRKIPGTSREDNMSGELAPPRKSVELEDPGAKELGMTCKYSPYAAS